MGWAKTRPYPFLVPAQAKALGEAGFTLNKDKYYEFDHGSVRYRVMGVWRDGRGCDVEVYNPESSHNYGYTYMWHITFEEVLAITR